MDRILGPYRGTLYAILRGAAGLLFACHGAQKLFGWFGGTGMEPPLVYAAGGIELVGGLLVAAGLFTSYAAFLCSGMMAVAYFMAHQGQGLLPIVNGGEKAAIYAWLFLFIAATGSGPISIDAARGGSGEVLR
jgi:putative oxidoreductase